jgi:hypothetical protein
MAKKEVRKKSVKTAKKSRNLTKIITYDQVKAKIIEIRDQKVILDNDVAALYGVETRDINKAVKNNPGKFPKNYIFTLKKSEKLELVENFHRFDSLVLLQINL